MIGWYLFRKESYQSRSIVLLAVLALCGGRLSAAETSAASGTAGHQVIPLTNISAERGREFLGRLTSATASKLPGSNALLVTAEPSELQKATAILNLVDSRTEFDIKELGPASAGPALSSLQLVTAAHGISMGTFAHPPQDKSKMQAIVDVHNGTLVVIAPAFQLENIKLAVQTLRQREGDAERASSRPEMSPRTHAVDLGTRSQPLGKPTNVVPAGPTVQAAALPVPSEKIASLKPQRASDIQAPQPASSFEPLTANLSQTGSGQPQEPARGNDTPQKPAQQPEPAAEPKAQPVAQPPSQTAPEQAAPAGAAPLSGQPAAAPSRPQTATPTQPAAAPASAQPGQVKPLTATPVAPAAAQPQPQTTPSAAPRATSPAQVSPSAYRVGEIPNGEEVLDLTLQEKMPIIQLLDLVGKYLGLSYVYNPEEVKGEVSLKLNGELHGPVKVKDLYTLLESSLRQANLVTTQRRGNIVTIAPITRAIDLDPILIDHPGAHVETGDTAVTCKFELKYIDTNAAKSLLDSMNVGINITAIPEKRMLMVTSYAYRMERVSRLLEMIDQPGEPKKFRPRQLRYTMAKALTDKVKAMAEQMLESVSVTVAESESATPSLARNPNENDATYRARVMQLRAQQTQQQAALRAQQAVLRSQTGGAENKPTVYLDADERTNRILMIGAEKQLVIVDELVTALDVEQQDLRALQLYRMKHVDADDVARKLQELGVISRLPDSLGSSRYGSSMSSRITPQMPGQPRLPGQPAVEPQVATNTEVTEKGLVEEPQVVVVEATNALLVNATAEQHAKIAHIIEYVDSETLTDEIPYKIYPLENSSPSHLAEVLQGLIQETVEQQKEGGKIEKVVVNKDEKIKIVPDPNTYSLIVYANKKNQEWISSLITQLDKRRPQVLIDVTLVAITKYDKFDMELNLLRSSPDIASTSGITGATTEKMLGKAVQTGSGGLTAFYGDKQVQALLDTVQAKTFGRVLAKPKLLVNDNENGKLDAKDITYVETTSALPVASGVPGTTGGLVQTSTTFQSYDAGIMLDITPHISEGDLLRLDIKLTRSDFGTMLGTRPPDKKSSEVDTAVTLPNGTTAILGGLVKLNETKGGSKVPILGDIPLLGGLFRGIHNSEQGEFLYMFVKAEIIRPDDAAGHGMKQLEELSERNRQAFEKRELEYQTYQDWPGIKPKRVDPSKVLDAQ